MHLCHIKFWHLAYLYKAAVEGEIMADGVLPGSLVGSVIRESFHDELIDAR